MFPKPLSMSQIKEMCLFFVGSLTLRVFFRSKRLWSSCRDKLCNISWFYFSLRTIHPPKAFRGKWVKWGSFGIVHKTTFYSGIIFWTHANASVIITHVLWRGNCEQRVTVNGFFHMADEYPCPRPPPLELSFLFKMELSLNSPRRDPAGWAKRV